MIASGLACVVALGIAWPLLRSASFALPSRAEHDFAIFEAQLNELHADAGRGAIGSGEAEIARAEIARKLLKAADGRTGPALAAGRAVPAGLALLVLLPLGALGVYGDLGSPDVPDLPLAARLQGREKQPDLKEMVAEVERRLAENPADASGWDVIAPVYLRLGEPNKAADAYRRAVALLGTTPAREAGLGEALTRQAGGEVTPEAEALFRRVAAADPGSVPARFFLALNLSQEQRFGEAVPAWRSLLAASPDEGAPWLPMARAALADATAKLAGASPGEALAAVEPREGAEPPGPDAQDIAAAASLSPQNRRAMIDGMVSQLAERLKTAPNDVEGWQRLIRSYDVLGDGENALKALHTASAVFPDGSREHAAIAGLAADLGLSASDATGP